LALSHQACKSHGLRNTEALVEALTSVVAQDPDGSLAAIGVSEPQAVADLQQLGALIHTRQPEQVTELEQLCSTTIPRLTPPAQPSMPVWPIVCACSSWIAGTSGRA